MMKKGKLNRPSDGRWWQPPAQAILGCVLRGAPEWQLLPKERRQLWNTAIIAFSAREHADRSRGAEQQPVPLRAQSGVIYEAR